ncbi:MAG: energy transducer TonB, partial [Acidobacteriota bacterium]|nr:energy transducer TonB [Acidobacteriota bacterium]
MKGKPVFKVLAVLILCSPLTQSQSPVRLAVVDLVGDEGRGFSTLLRDVARTSNNEFNLLDDELVRAASRGAGYTDNLNLSRDEARALGQSLGCDFYVLGKVQSARRQDMGEQFYFDALAGLFFVETRTGNLILFVFERTKAQDESNARNQLKEILTRNWPQYTEAIRSARQQHLLAVQNIAQPSPSAVEVLTDNIAAQGVQQPVFYQRIKPDYTEQADLAGIVATVELETVFRNDGTIGEVELVKWAGFGLDESAIATVKKLRFKPAEHSGKKLTIKGLVRYNFRRPLSQAEKLEEI